MLSYIIAIDKNEDGNFQDSSDIITPDVVAMRWQLGMAQPYEVSAAPSLAEIVVQNPAGAYSPERSGLRPGCRVRIQSFDGTQTRVHFTGTLWEIAPVPGDQGGRQAVLRLRGVDDELAQQVVSPAALVDVRADEVIAHLIQRCKLRYPVLATGLIPGEAGRSLPGRLLFGAPLALNLAAGKTTFAFTDDLWSNGVNVWQALHQMAQHEDGAVFINRAGEVCFVNRHHRLLRLTPAASFRQDMAAMTYRYGTDIVNQVDIRMTPRRIGAAGSLLWSLTETQKLSAGSVRRLVARYRDPAGEPVGALTVERIVPVARSRPDGSGAALDKFLTLRVISQGASSATLEIQNNAIVPAYLTQLQVYGTPILRGDTLYITESDPRSQTYYGCRRLFLDLPALTAVEDAAGLARSILIRRRSPRGVVPSLTVNPAQQPAALGLTLFDRIRLEEGQTGHAHDHFIIGETHEVDHGGLRHRLTWALQPADDDLFMTLGRDRLSEQCCLAY